MEIIVKVEAPEFAEALNNFANTLSAFMCSGAQYPTETAADIARASAAAGAPKQEAKPASAPKAEAKPQEAPALIAQDQLPEIRQKVKAFLDLDVENRVALKNWLAAHDTDRVTHIKQADVADLLKLIGG